MSKKIIKKDGTIRVHETNQSTYRDKWNDLLKIKLHITSLEFERDKERKIMMEHQEKFRSLSQQISQARESIMGKIE
jgi:hypothetical protein